MITPKALVNRVMPNAAQSLIYESASDEITTIKFGMIVNNSGGSITVNLFKKSGANTSSLITPNLPLDNHESIELDTVIQLNPGDQILGDTSSASGVSIILDGFNTAT